MPIDYLLPPPLIIPAGYVLLDDDEPIQVGDKYWTGLVWSEGETRWGTPRRANSVPDGRTTSHYPFYRPGGVKKKTEEKEWLNPWD